MTTVLCPFKSKNYLHVEKDPYHLGLSICVLQPIPWPPVL